MPMEPLDIFAATLKRLRASSGLSQPDLAKQTGIPQTTLSRWETGESEPGLRGLATLAQFFGISTDTLCGLASPPDMLRAGNWLVDADLVEQHQTRKLAGETWAVAIPDRFRLVTSAEYQRIRDALHQRKKR